MKRIVTLTLAAALLLCALPAQAETWFPDVSGTLIHRDPFCTDRLLTLDSYFQAAVQYASREVILAEGEYTICPACDGASVPVPEESALYYNPAGGSRLHHGPECPAVSEAYRPLTPIADAEGDIPQQRCFACGPRVITSPADTDGWNASCEEQALFLPGVWTLPADDALTQEAAYAIARTWVSASLPDGQEFCVCPMHYDDARDVGDDRETWKVIVTSVLRHPMYLLYIDAQTGEVYHHQLAAEYAE